MQLRYMIRVNMYLCNIYIIYIFEYKDDFYLRMSKVSCNPFRDARAKMTLTDVEITSR